MSSPPAPSPATSRSAQSRAQRDDLGGIGFALTAYVMWGFVPIYYKQMPDIPPIDIAAYRAVATCLFLVVIRGLQGELTPVFRQIGQSATARPLVISSLLIGTNWVLFVTAVATSQIRQSSFGYFLTPVITVLLGAVALRERLDRHHLISLAITAVAIGNEMWQVGRLPFISLGLAFSFGTYGLVRKTMRTDAVTGLTAETIVLLPLALAYLVLCRHDPPRPSAHNWLLILGNGPVTALPLICYVAGARRIRMSTLGFLQYLAPSMQLAVAVFLYSEPLPRAHLASFLIIWCAIGIFLAGELRQRRAVP